MFTIEEVRTNNRASLRILPFATHIAATKSRKTKSNPMNLKTISTTLALVVSCGLTALAQTPQFNIIKPSTTGVPGEQDNICTPKANPRTAQFEGRGDDLKN